MQGLAGLGRSWLRLALALALLVPLAACGTFKNVAGPSPAFSIDSDIKQFSEKYASSTSITEYYTKPAGEARRNEFVVGRLTLYNLQYIKFIHGFAIDRAQSQASFDITNLTLGVANSLVGGEADHAALTAATTLLGGSRVAIDKAFFADQAVPALVTQMNASRQAALVPILEGLKQKEDVYGLPEALVDLQKYYEAGTIQGALMEVQVAASMKKNVADRQIEALRSQRFQEDAASKRIGRWIWPTGASQNPGGVWLDAAGAVAPENSARVTDLRAWLKKNGWEGVPVQQFINGKTFADARETAVIELSIPALN